MRMVWIVAESIQRQKQILGHEQRQKEGEEKEKEKRGQSWDHWHQDCREKKKMMKMKKDQTFVSGFERLDELDDVLRGVDRKSVV